jgi:hypothetical protein
MSRSRRAGRPPPERALRELQRRFARLVMQPLTADDALAPATAAGEPVAAEAAALLRAGPGPAPLARLQIYARCYWFRLIDCLHEDCPGLRALLGEARFGALVRAYVARHPSRSFTLRNLAARLPDFIRTEPHWTAPDTRRAEALARLEWAGTVAFDGALRPALTTGDLAAVVAGRRRVALQPCLTLLASGWALDEYLLALQRREALRAAASHTPGAPARGRRRVASPAPPPGRRIWLAVHRVDNRIYYKRLDPAAFRILAALQAGRPLAAALLAGGPRATPGRVRRWCATWMELGWLCRR